MQALLDVAACSVVTLGPPFVAGLEDGPLLVSLLFLLCTGGQGVSILIKFRMTFIQPMEPLFTSWTYFGGSLISIIFFRPVLACDIVFSYGWASHS